MEGAISMEGHSDLYRLDNDTLSAIRYQDETLVQWVLGPPGVQQCPASCDETMQAVPGG